MRYSLITDCEFIDDAHKLNNALVNILAIVKHFQIKIKDWLVSQGLSTPTEEQVLDVVRKNYDLTLKLQDSLDHYERYAESPKHINFFTNMVRDIIIDTRKQVYTCIKEANHSTFYNIECAKYEKPNSGINETSGYETSIASV